MNIPRCAGRQQADASRRGVSPRSAPQTYQRIVLPDVLSAAWPPPGGTMRVVTTHNKDRREKRFNCAGACLYALTGTALKQTSAVTRSPLRL